MVAEHFYSIQGEGFSAGTPAYFIRLSKCNLMCGGKDGSLMKEGKASWWCDTEAVWRKGTDIPPAVIINEWKQNKIFHPIVKGDIHIIWTGGEPLLKNSISYMESFYRVFYEELEQVGSFFSFYDEVETNGTIELPSSIDFSQINCSPKLSNSGMSKKIRIVPEALLDINSHTNSWFKFVVDSEKDIEEIYTDFLKPEYITNDKIILMPAMIARDEFHKKTEWIFEMAKKYRLKAMSRLHVSAWDKTVGV